MVEYVVSVAGGVLVFPYSVTAPNVNTKGVMISVRMTLFIARPQSFCRNLWPERRCKRYACRWEESQPLTGEAQPLIEESQPFTRTTAKSFQLRVGVVFHGFLSSGFCF